jgi:hypothetical protein
LQAQSLISLCHKSKLLSQGYLLRKLYQQHC